jgi:hypothetical protein
MDCYECAIRGEAVAAVAMCKHCGVGMCLEHFLIAHDYRMGGTTYGCRHYLPSKPKGGARKRVPALGVAAHHGHRRLRRRAAAPSA